MKTFSIVLSFMTIFFLVEYESYTWNPCNGDACLAIICYGPGGMCETPGASFFVKTMGEVREIVDRNGTEHLGGMYRIEYSDGKAKVHELKLVPSFVIEDADGGDLSPLTSDWTDVISFDGTNATISDIGELDTGVSEGK